MGYRGLPNNGVVRVIFGARLLILILFCGGQSRCLETVTHAGSPIGCPLPYGSKYREVVTPGSRPASLNDRGTGSLQNTLY